VQTVFITGAGGYVGSQLLAYLKGQGYEVVAGVRNRARKLAYERENTKALVCEVTDPINVARVIASVRPDAVVHLAGLTQPREAAADPLAAYQTIVTSWANVLDAVRRSNPRAKILLASSSEVYGNAGSDGRPLRESTPLLPTTTFGSLKATAESIAATFHRDYHLDVTIARPFVYTGPQQPERFFLAAVAQRLANWNAARDGDELALPDLACARDVLHSDDVLSAYATLLAEGRPNETYNICSGTARSCRELVQWMIEAAGVSVRLVDSPADDDGPAIRSLCGDQGKLEGLGWSATRSATDALGDLMASYQQAETSAAV
jgi:GDP-4-dehydro-6-deoxy-D-mannose reductase